MEGLEKSVRSDIESLGVNEKEDKDESSDRIFNRSMDLKSAVDETGLIAEKKENGCNTSTTSLAAVTNAPTNSNL